MSPLIQGAIAFVCVFSAALVAISFRPRVPDRYQGADSKDVVRQAMGLVITTVALALGLLIGSAKSFYDTQNAEMAQIGANYIMLDRIPSFYGPESADARAELRAVLARHLEESGRRLRGTDKTYTAIKSGADLGDTLFDKISRLSPKDDSQRYFKQECMNLGYNWAKCAG